MIAEKEVTVRNTLGIHVRPATNMAEAAGRFRSQVSVIKDGKAVNAKSSVELLTMAAVSGTELQIRAEGEDAQEAVDLIARLIETGFGEE